MNAHERILVALDCDTMDDALALAARLAGKVGGFKVGLELVNAVGFTIFDRLRDAGIDRIFYDAKFHDIPNTVAGAVRAAARRGVWMVNVHASGGRAMLEAAAEAARSAAQPPLLIGVTVLTSLDQGMLRDELHVTGTVRDHVVHLAQLCQDAAFDGVVASPQELSALRATCGAGFVTVVPGIRPAGVGANDQKRIATPGLAVQQGADYLVIGRAITAALDPGAAAEQIAAELKEALHE